MSFTHALKWSFASELAAKAIQPVVFIVLARLLTPEDFGVMTAAMMVIAFSQIFWEAGMGKALIQRQIHIEEAANAAFFINIALGIVIAGGLYLFAQPIAQAFFQDDRVTAVLQVMTLQVLLGALSSVQTALLQKEMGFNKLFWVRFVTVSLPSFASIPLAWLGWGYWALVAGNLTGYFLQTIMLWMMSSWRPTLVYSRDVTIDMARFSVWVSSSNVLGWFFAWGDSLVVGYFLGIDELGKYRLAMTIVNALIGVLYSAVGAVSYSAMVRQTDNVSRINNIALSGEKLIVLLFFLFTMPFLMFGEQLLATFVGDKWEGVGELAGLLLVSASLASSVSMRQEAYKAIGRPDLETKVMAISAAIRLPIYLFSIQFGIVYFVLGRIVSVCLGIVNHLVVSHFCLGSGLMAYMRSLWKIMVLSIVVLMVVYFTQAVLNGFSIREGVLLLFAYVLLMFFSERESLKRIYYDVSRKF